MSSISDSSRDSAREVYKIPVPNQDGQDAWIDCPPVSILPRKTPILGIVHVLHGWLPASIGAHASKRVNPVPWGKLHFSHPGP